MLRAIWSRILLLLTGKSAGLSEAERAAEMEAMRRRFPDIDQKS